MLDTTLQVGEQVMLRTMELLDAAGVGKLRPGGREPLRWRRSPAPLPRRFKCSPTVNVDRLKPHNSLAARRNPPDQRPAPGLAGSQVVEQLLNRTTLRRDRTYFLVRWQGRPSADDSWEPLKQH